MHVTFPVHCSHLLSDMEIAVAEDYHRLGNYQSVVLFALCGWLGPDWF